jgi:hypothetical protein
MSAGRGVHGGTLLVRRGAVNVRAWYCSRSHSGTAERREALPESCTPFEEAAIYEDRTQRAPAACFGTPP